MDFHQFRWPCVFGQGQADKSSQLLSQILPWLLALVGVVFVGGAVIYMLRRWLRSDADEASGGFTLQDLRNLHASGELSLEEFERARAQMIGRVKPSAETSDPADPPNPPGNLPA